jgi:hypothetical protein
VGGGSCGAVDCIIKGGLSCGWELKQHLLIGVTMQVYCLETAIGVRVAESRLGSR